MQQVLYREYRPETFKEVLGQETIIKILKSQVDTVMHICSVERGEQERPPRLDCWQRR